MAICGPLDHEHKTYWIWTIELEVPDVHYFSTCQASCCSSVMALSMNQFLLSSGVHISTQNENYKGTRGPNVHKCFHQWILKTWILHMTRLLAEMVHGNGPFLQLTALPTTCNSACQWQSSSGASHAHNSHKATCENMKGACYSLQIDFYV